MTASGGQDADGGLRTRTLSEPRGFVKMLIDQASDRILGLTVFDAEASEIMAAVQVAKPLPGFPSRRCGTPSSRTRPPRKA
jgi:pyruvate/2-oxoglutarate dehydrogenase complex dihydrolipoamide dehydrogenase (E3) component